MTAAQPDQADRPDVRSRGFLLGHIRDTMAFYHPRCIDPAGGFFHFFSDDGTVYDRQTRHLVSSTRFVFNYSMAWQAFGDPAYREAVAHGLGFLRDAHRNPGTGGYAWVLHDGQVQDATNHCYGLAFVVLAYAKALEAGFEPARGWLDETWALMELRFWEPQHGLYADEADADWKVSPYRGQNANMHACEAWLAAFEATGEERYLQRAALLAENMTRRQAALADGLVWEHYDSDWRVDWDYNRGDRSNIFRPWGFQPGHQVEWAKLLLILDRHVDADWLLPTARHLFDSAVTRSWDATRGGLYYGFAPAGLQQALNEAKAPSSPALDGRAFAEETADICDDDKYFWVQAESLAAAALLAGRTGDDAYWQWYERLWAYAWQHMVDHRYGAWFRILDADNRRYDDEKSPAGKTDYHTMGACHEVLNVVRAGQPG